MTDLLTKVIEAHGGLDRWQAVRHLRAEVSFAGPFWTQRSVPTTALTRLVVEVEPHVQRATLRPWFDESDSFTLTVAPETATITHGDGRSTETLANPRASFPNTGPQDPWGRFQVGYFLSYGLWNYLTTPFLLTYPGVRTRETDPWQEDDHYSWRRLEVTFPDTVATHCRVQTFYFDDRGFLRRMDYLPDVAAGPANPSEQERSLGVAHYVDGHTEVGGFVFPTLRSVFPRRADNTPAGRTSTRVDGLTISLAIHDISVT